MGDSVEKTEEKKKKTFSFFRQNTKRRLSRLDLEDNSDNEDDSTEQDDSNDDSGKQIDLEKTMNGVMDLEEKKKVHPYWFVLLGSSLFYYKSVQNTKKPAGVIELKGATITEVSEPTNNSLQIGGKKKQVISVHNSWEKKDWMAEFNKALTLDTVPTPDKLKLTKTGLGNRLKKNITGKVAVSSSGKKAMRNSVPEDIQSLVFSLKAVLATYYDEGIATVVEDNLIKMFIKSFFLEDEGLLVMEDFKDVDGPVRKAFSMLMKIRDSTLMQRHVSEEAINNGMIEVIENARLSEKRLKQLMIPLLKPKSIQRLSVIYTYVADATFLKKTFVRGEKETDVEDEIDELYNAMERYCAENYFD